MNAYIPLVCPLGLEEGITSPRIGVTDGSEWTLRWPQVADETLVICTAIGGNRSCRHQLRPWLV